MPASGSMIPARPATYATGSATARTAWLEMDAATVTGTVWLSGTSGSSVVPGTPRPYTMTNVTAKTTAVSPSVTIAVTGMARRAINSHTAYRPTPAITTGSTVALAPDAPTMIRTITTQEPSAPLARQDAACNRSAIRARSAMRKMRPNGNVQLAHRWKLN